MEEFIFIPNTYNDLLRKEKKIEENEILILQEKYRKGVELLLKNVIDFKKIDHYIDSFGYNIPFLADTDYNFYHRYSFLESKYLYLRNNIHIENLEEEEINVLRDCVARNTELDVSFIRSTFGKVLFENNDVAMFGVPTIENAVNSKSIVFEFAYDQKKMTDPRQYDFANKIYEEIKPILSNGVSEALGASTSFIKYVAIPDIYRGTNNSERRMLM